MNEAEDSNIVDFPKWVSEPDVFQAECVLIVRNPTMKHLCGYVGVPEGNILHGMSHTDMYEIDVHGGLTFSGFHAKEWFEAVGATHHPGVEGMWWFGFDCAHFGDLVPGYKELERSGGFSSLTLGDNYRDIEFVKQECLSLGKQLVNLGNRLKREDGDR